jgi:KRAB domain-containing zinc finger protein
MEDQTRLKCGECDSSFAHVSHLNRHVASIHEKQTFLCDKCGKICSRKDNLDRHMESCLDGKRRKACSGSGKVRFKCELCTSSFGLLGNFKRHMTTVHEPRTFTCDECERCFSLKHHLSCHVKSCLGGKKTRKALDSGSGVEGDMKRSDCDSYNGGSDGVDRASKRHVTNGDSGPITTNPLTPTSSADIQTTESTTKQLTNEPHHECYECNKVFKWKLSLVKHLKKCRAAYYCQKCNATFSTRKSSSEHIIQCTGYSDDAYDDSGE